MIGYVNMRHGRQHDITHFRLKVFIIRRNATSMTYTGGKTTCCQHAADDAWRMDFYHFAVLASVIFL